MPVNIKGVAIIDGMIDVHSQAHSLATYQYSAGLINYNTFSKY